ncbi:MAG: class I SAM-dependent rRNA methyltransferase [Lachnospiraceae bacterium]|nr:class I SAM-dependent rRNA methyltransferase [Lachnospiraceae bacterium]
MAEVILKKGGGRYLKSGGRWIYDNEIDRIEGEFVPGDTVDVFDFDGYKLGKGYINPKSTITVRMLERYHDDPIDESFWEKKVRAAWEYRKSVVDTSCCRVIFSESDGFPGLVIDKFEDVLVAECETLGMERHKEIICDLVKKVLAEDGINIRGVYERSDASVRKLEGLDKVKGFIGGPFDTNVVITENGVKYGVNIEEGQKTGFFLDQKYNRAAAAKLCKGKKVLDCFTHTGSFALNAGLAGAESVLGVDASELAVEQARENAKLNGLEDTVKFTCADVFDLLPKLVGNGESYDVVILDPPAFTKSRSATKNAVKGYREINMKGMKLVKPGGFLCTCSCSHFMTPELLEKTILEAAKGARKRLRLVEYRMQSPDHPYLMGCPESLYLKFFIYQVFEEY